MHENGQFSGEEVAIFQSTWLITSDNHALLIETVQGRRGIVITYVFGLFRPIIIFNQGVEIDR